MYLWTCSSSMAGFGPGYGVMTSPQKWSVELPIREGRRWGMDNASFSGSFDSKRFMAHLEKLNPYRDRCLFITVPDRVADATTTMRLWHEWNRTITGWPLAFVAQDGQENLPLPDGYDVLFIGGSNAFKLGRAGETCIDRALSTGKRVHVGRVNSQKRYRHFASLGVHSCDGTGPIYEPDGFRRLLDAVIGEEPTMFSRAVSGGDRWG